MRDGFSAGGRPLGAEEISMMRGLLREYCSLRRCDRQGDIAEDAARYLVSLYQSGLGSEDELRRGFLRNGARLAACKSRRPAAVLAN